MITFTCPRRFMGHDNEDTWCGDGTCSYCGSMSPDTFFQKIEEGVSLGPTDKNYKVYVGDRGKFYFQHLTSDQQTRFIALLNARKLTIGFPGHFYNLPFFIALKAAE